MNITGTHINYYHVCKRQLWFVLNGLEMEHTSDLVLQGKVIHETTYPQRPEEYEEIEIGGSKIDYYDPKRRVIHEIKKSSKMFDAHVWQLKYYIFLMEQYGVEDVTGILEYPVLRKTRKVKLNDKDKTYLESTIQEIKKMQTSICPNIQPYPFCNSCSFYDFCAIGETYE